MPALLLCISGCASIPAAVRDLPEPEPTIELADTPFYPQEKYQCGPAALATALGASGVRSSTKELADKVYIPGREGSLQVELLAATRTAGRVPYRLDASLMAIIKEIQAGRPVIVLQNLGVSLIPRWHYAVVVGYDGDSKAVILRSGTDKRRLTPVDLFLRTWSRSDYWAITVLRPDEMPNTVDRQRYLASIADLEQVGMLQEASIAWQTALKRWPDDVVARFGLANTLLALRQASAAEHHYRILIAAQPELIPARNNLAFALHQQGRIADALLEIETALQLTQEPTLLAVLLDSKNEIGNAIH